MKELIQNLVKLQSLEFSKEKSPNVAGAMADLRAKIPAQILGHYDRLVAHGKKGVAAVHGQVCSGCHMQVPLGAVMTLRHGEDIQLCESCGRYLYLLPAQPIAAIEPTAGPKLERKPRKPKRSLQVA
ncbi:MAG: C4-type zinc ribbon domain-containing protein [Verrucomicrobiia bacterium]